MRKTLIIIAVALVLCLCGCSEVPQVSDIPTEPSQSESLPIKDSEEISQETDAPKSSVNINPPKNPVALLKRRYLMLKKRKALRSRRKKREPQVIA